MKTCIPKSATKHFRNLLLVGVALALAGVWPAEAAPKRVLVVTTTLGFRHSSIPTAEDVLGELARKSGAFTVDYARVESRDEKYRGADGKPDKAKYGPAIEAILAEKMSPAALKKLDAVIFANTTGDLPIPDKEAFLSWIKSGKGFVGMHSATDTFHNYPAFIEMIGGQFKTHGPQVEVDAINQDATCPSCAHLPPTWKIFDEIYILKNFERSKVHGLLTLEQHPNDKTPGDYPIAWRKDYGQGRVFYTSLGHREDVWCSKWTDDKGRRKNSPDVAEAYQQHILGGIKWALGLEEPRAPGLKPE